MGVKTFLSSVKSELNDPYNRRQAKCNIPPEEVEALGALMKLQKDRKIVIKPCDKGAGIIILNFEEYITACKTHLDSEQIDENGIPSKYYEEVNKKVLKEVKKKILNLLEEGINNRIISKTILKP